MSFYKGTILLLLGLLLLSGCFNSKTPAEEIYDVLEQVVVEERAFEEQQDLLVHLEKQEKELYDEIITLGMKEYDKIVKLSDEALTVVEKRKEHINKEEESIQASRRQFENVQPLIDKLEDGKVKGEAEELYDIMLARYIAHDDIYENYMKGLEYDKELYEMFQKKDITAEKLEENINKINETYQIVLEANKTFNEQTKKYNEAKLQFYQSAGIEVKETNK